MPATLTTLLTSAETWWTSGPGAPDSSVLRYGRPGRAFHLAALLGLSGVRDLDAWPEVDTGDEPTPLLRRGRDRRPLATLGTHGMRLGPRPGAWPGSTHQKPEPSTLRRHTTPSLCWPGWKTTTQAEQQHPSSGNVYCRTLHPYGPKPTASSSPCQTSATQPNGRKSRTDRRRAIRLAFRTLVTNTGPAGVKVGAVMASAEEETGHQTCERSEDTTQGRTGRGNQKRWRTQ